jgi:hypothetical protein
MGGGWLEGERYCRSLCNARLRRVLGSWGMPIHIIQGSVIQTIEKELKALRENLCSYPHARDQHYRISWFSTLSTLFALRLKAFNHIL